MISKYFLAVCSLSFHTQNTACHRAKGFNSDEVQLTHFSFMGHLFGVMSKNSLPNHRSQRFSTLFSSKSFIVLHLYLRSILSKFVYECGL